MAMLNGIKVVTNVKPKEVTGTANGGKTTPTPN